MSTYHYEINDQQHILKIDQETGTVANAWATFAQFAFDEKQRGVPQIVFEDVARRLAAIDHPKHYNAHPSGIECITIVEQFNFNLGNAIKYIWRAGLKSEAVLTDLEKARWYINREIERLQQP